MKALPARSLQTIVLALIVIGLIALALGGYLSPVTRLALSPLVSAQTWLSTRYQAIASYIGAPQDVARLRQRLSELETENAQLQSEIIDLKQEVNETRVLAALVDFRRERPENEMVTATVIGRDTKPFLQYVIINRGSDDGLRRGMPVVTQQGLVGRVVAVTAQAARVQLITDASSRVNVKMESSEAEAVMQGSITGDIHLDMIPQSADIQEGELILTSGLGGNYPANLPVGQVTGIRARETDLFKTASVQPVVDFRQLEIVLVITNFRPVDISPLIPPEGP